MVKLNNLIILHINKEARKPIRFQGLFCSRSLLRGGQGLWVGRSKMAATPARRQEEERPWGRRCPQTRQCKTCNACLHACIHTYNTYILTMHAYLPGFAEYEKTLCYVRARVVNGHCRFSLLRHQEINWKPLNGRS